MQRYFAESVILNLMLELENEKWIERWNFSGKVRRKESDVSIAEALVIPAKYFVPRMQELGFRPVEFEDEILYLSGTVDESRVKIILATEQCWGAQELYWTGSAEFILGIYRAAARRGFVFSSRGIATEHGNFIRTLTEQDVFALSDSEYIPPEAR